MLIGLSTSRICHMCVTDGKVYMLLNLTKTDDDACVHLAEEEMGLGRLPHVPQPLLARTLVNHWNPTHTSTQGRWSVPCSYVQAVHGVHQWTCKTPCSMIHAPALRDRTRAFLGTQAQLRALLRWHLLVFATLALPCLCCSGTSVPCSAWNAREEGKCHSQSMSST